MKKKGLAALKESDPIKFNAIQQAGVRRASEVNYGWTAERRAKQSQKLKAEWEIKKNANQTLQSR